MARRLLALREEGDSVDEAMAASCTGRRTSRAVE